MSAIFGESLTFKQEQGPDVRLVVFGDEFYARYENMDGFTAVYDADLGLFAYAIVVNGHLVSCGVPTSAPSPAGLRRHLKDAEFIRQERDARRRGMGAPRARAFTATDTMRTIGPNEGLLEGRRLSVGNVRGLTVLVEFQDVTTTVTRAEVEEMLNGQNYSRNGNFCSVREYFHLVSGGKLDYTNEVVGPFKLSRNRAYYVQNLLVEEALNLAVAAGLDLTRFDSRQEGIVDAINILYAGQTQYLKELWPHNSSIDLRFGNTRTDLYLLTSLGRTNADLSIGTFCHENGHLLCRFPDMYDYGNRDGDGVESAGIGAYCLMGSGNHLNNGRTPSPVCAYLRDLAGWCENVVDLNQPGELDAIHADYRTVMKFKTDKRNEYFLVENRSRLGLDQHLPSSGLAVYHCDTRGSNELQEGSSTRHYQCALLQADGHLDLEHNINQGDGTDLFASGQGTLLDHGTTPSSRQWDGADSGLVLSKVEVPGDQMKFTVGQLSPGNVARGEAVPALAIPDDNPAGVSSTIQIGQLGTVREIKVSVDITHTYVGDLEVDLIAPDNSTKARLHNRTGAGKDNLITTFTAVTAPELSRMAAQAAQGQWTLIVRDVAGLDVGKLNRWSIEIALSAAPAPTVRGDATPNLPIPDNNPTGVSSAIVIASPGNLRQIKVGVEITHTYIGDLRLELVSPSGRGAVLRSRLGGGQDNLVESYDSAAPSSPLAPLLGQSMQGAWTLRVADVVSVDVGTLNKWSLELVAGT